MKKALKITAYVLGGILALLLIVILLLNTGPGKNFVRNKAESFLQKKLKTEVHIGGLDYRLPKWIELQDVFLRDKAGDTLLNTGKLRVDIDMIKLLSNQVEIQEIQLIDAYANIYRNQQDTTFNFNFIIEAFAADQAAADTAATDTTSRMRLDIEHLVLNNVRVNFLDRAGGALFAANVNALDLKMNQLDPYNMLFDIESLRVNGLSSYFTIDTNYLAVSTDTSTAAIPDIRAGELHLENVNFTFNDSTTATYMNYVVGTLDANPEKIDLPNQRIAMNSLLLANARVSILMKETIELDEPVDTTIVSEPVPEWYITADELTIDSVDFVLNNENVPKQQYGIDYNHLYVQNLVLDAQDVFYSFDTITGDINHLALQEQSGLDVSELKTNFAWMPQGAYLRDLYLETSNTVLRDYAEISYPSLEAIGRSPEMMKVKINLENSVVGMQDILTFVPDLRNQELFRRYGNDKLNLTATVTGFLNDLNIRTFQASGLANTNIDLSGTLKGLPDMNKLQYNLDIARLQSTDAVANALMPASMQQQIDVPASFSLNGKVSGTMQYFNTNVAIRTTDGYVWARGYIDLAPSGNERYDMYVRTQSLEVGNIIRNPNIGSISAVMNVKGRSFDPKRANATASGTINAFGFQGYTYNNISLNANIANQQAEYDITSDDPNARLDLTGTANFSGQYPSVNAKLNIDSADFQKLNLSTEPLRVRSLVLIDMPVLNPDYPEGRILVDRATVVSNGERYYLDSMTVTSQPSADSGQNIVVDADGIDATITGRTPLTQIGNIVQNHLSRYYNISRADSIAAVRAVPPSYSLQLHADITNGSLLRSFMPKLERFDTANIDAGLAPDRLYVNARFPHIVYDNIIIDSANAEVNGSGNALTYNVAAEKFLMNNLRMWKPTASGRMSGNTITGDVSISDSALTERFAINAEFHQHGDTSELHLNEGLKLNYENWQVAQPNRIVFGSDGIYIDNFRISNGAQSISANSTGQGYTSPIDIAINDFLLSSITEIFQSDTLLANGLANGQFTVQNVMTQPKANGFLNISSLSVMNDTIGNLELQLQEASANAIGATASITGQGNNVSISGNYYPEPVNGNNFDLNINIQTLNAESVQGLAMNQIKNTSGYIRGNLQVQGTMDRPVVTGSLRTDQLATNVSTLNSRFLLPSETIRFTKDGIVFENVKIVDSNGNVGFVDGKITTQDYRTMQLALNVNTDRFQVLNSTAQHNELFYGDLFVSSNLDIGGSLQSPSIDGKITIHDSTKLTVEVPQNQVQIQEREGIVQFVDMDNPNRHRLLVDTAEQEKMMNFISPTSTFNVNVELNKNAEFNIVLDQGTGDFLRVRGEAALNTYVAPDGTLALSGVFELKEGTYELNYNFIRRRFDIQSGSTITFAGDPTDAVVDVKAVYVANVPPYELVENQINDKQTLVYYKERIPFNVVLAMQGDLMQPEISFNIELPEEKSYNVSGDVLTTTRAKLARLRNNPSELNKQVFAVLILNRFVSEDPFSSETGTSAEYIARQSASRFISEQLNRFADQLIQGFELSFNLQSYEDYTTGSKRQRTDLNVAASKRLLNDRLKITVGEDFGVEGEGGNRNRNTNLIPGNISAAYELTPDGRYRVRFYRRNEDEGIVEGYVVETGVSFIVTLDYNRFRDIFIRRNKDKDKQEKKPRGAAN